MGQARGTVPGLEQRIALRRRLAADALQERRGLLERPGLGVLGQRPQGRVRFRSSRTPGAARATPTSPCPPPPCRAEGGDAGVAAHSPSPPLGAERAGGEVGVCAAVHGGELSPYRRRRSQPVRGRAEHAPGRRRASTAILPPDAGAPRVTRVFSSAIRAAAAAARAGARGGAAPRGLAGRARHTRTAHPRRGPRSGWPPTAARPTSAMPRRPPAGSACTRWRRSTCWSSSPSCIRRGRRCPRCADSRARSGSRCPRASRTRHRPCSGPPRPSSPRSRHRASRARKTRPPSRAPWPAPAGSGGDCGGGGAGGPAAARAPGAGRTGDGGALAVWTRLKEWQESAPPPAPGHDPVPTAAARQRLAHLLGEGAEPRPEQADFASAACRRVRSRRGGGRAPRGAGRGRHRGRQDPRLHRAGEPLGRAQRGHGLALHVHAQPAAPDRPGARPALPGAQGQGREGGAAQGAARTTSACSTWRRRSAAAR